ncbi:serine/threonine-protein kinase Sgk3 isoform X17 [Myotis lucifugus]|nr:serine/threonine-protein kinase Sgk3 isoform X17 [Myotis lucifugus]XP_023611227.1 serine/threonine-protein kinase Sgk3 isoform X17 [Myotis lucifugus]
MSERSFKWTVRNTSQIHLKMRMKEVLRSYTLPHRTSTWDRLEILSSAKPTDFDFLKVIGKGSFGKVLLAKRKLDGKFYAVKVLQKKIVLNRREQKHIMAERNVLLKNVKHPFLVGLHYSFQTTEKLYFVLDFVNGGELFFHLQRERSFPEHRARFYAAEIASALGYLHSIKIVYRDLKPENILLDSVGHVVLTDFGLCKEGIAISDTTTTFCGTPEYLAPEVIRKQPYDNTVDWWCLGAVLYEMLYGLSTPIMPQYLGRSMIFRSSSFQPPFYCRDVAEMYDNILHKPLNLRPGVSLTAWSILEELLEKDRQNRLGAKEDFYLRQKCQLCFTYEETMIVKRIKCAMCTYLKFRIIPFLNHSVGRTLYKRRFHHRLILMWQDQMILGTLMQRLRKKQFHILCVCLLTIR